MNIKIGNSTKYTIKITPDTSGAKDLKMIQTTSGATLSCQLKFSWATNLVKSLKNNLIKWIFSNTEKKEFTELTYQDFKKTGDLFETAPILLPLSQFFDNNFKKVLKTKLNVKASIPNLNSGKLLSKEQIDVDFSYNIQGTIQTTTGDKIFNSIEELLKIKNAYLGSTIKIKHNKGIHIPSTFSSHLFIFEDDSYNLNELENTTYEFKFNSVLKQSEIHRNIKNEFESINYDEISLSTNFSTIYLGILPEKYIYCGDKEKIDNEKKLEFIFLLIYYNKTYSSTEFNKLSKTDIFYETLPKNAYYLTIKKPTIKFSSYRVDSQNYIFIINIEDVNPEMIDYNNFDISTGIINNNKFEKVKSFSISRPEVTKEKSKLSLVYKVYFSLEKKVGVKIYLEKIFQTKQNNYNNDFVNSVFEFENSDKIISLTNDGTKSVTKDHKIIFFEL